MVRRRTRSPSLRSTRDFFLVLTTLDSSASARRLARLAVESDLAACVNRIPQIRSTYRWKGKLEEGRESLLLLKTHRRRLHALCALIRKHHPYELPEILALPVSHGEPAYLQWITGNA